MGKTHIPWVFHIEVAVSRCFITPPPSASSERLGWDSCPAPVPGKQQKRDLQSGAPEIAKLMQITPITMVYR